MRVFLNIISHTNYGMGMREGAAEANDDDDMSLSQTQNGRQSAAEEGARSSSERSSATREMPERDISLPDPSFIRHKRVTSAGMIN